MAKSSWKNKTRLLNLIIFMNLQLIHIGLWNVTKPNGYVDNLLQNRLDRPGASIRRVGCGHILATEQRHPMQSREAEVWVE